DLADPDAYARVAASVDLDEFTNYLIHRAFIGYQIADLNNRFWRSREPGSKWRWIAADMEHAFGQLGGDPYTENTLAKLIGLPGNLPEWATLLFNRLLDHPDFRAVFIQRSAAWLNTIYQPDVTLAAVDSLAGLLAPHMPRHIGRWNTPPSIPAWQGNIQLIKTFLQHRPAHYRRHLTELFGAPDSVRVSFEIAGQGRVVVSGVPFSANTEGYFFKNTAIHLQAIPAPGFRFVAWQGLNSANDHTTFIPLGDTAFVAVFVPQNISIIPPLVEADTTLAASASPWYGLENIRVLPGARLRVEAGATLLMTDGVSIEVQGGLYLEGTADRRISVLSDPAPSARRSFYGQAGYWGAIWAENAGDSLVFQYADLLNGSFGPDRSRHFSTISTYNSRLRVENSRVLQGKAPLIARGGSAVLRHSEFHTPVSCNGFISLYDMNAPLIEHCVFRGNRAINTDGIDLKGISHAVVRYNHVYGFLGDNCDGIDFGIYSLNNLVEYNIIHDCSDKGISIGSQSNVLVRRNLIYDCDLGVALKDSLAVAHIDQNTFYGNRIAVACYEKSALRGGGKAFVKNSILAASGESGIFYDDQSEIQVSYSLSDREGLPGTGNLYADPVMIHPGTGNFELAGHSPCINTGDPFSPFDPDGSRADMGAYYTHTSDYGLSLHVNEFNYHPPFNYSCGDWIELHNSSDQSIDLKGWRMAQGLQFFEFETPALLAPGGYLIVCEDTARFAAFYPETVLKIGNSRMDFDNKSGKITLIDPTGRQVHCVRYADDRPWPPLADGRGATVELAQGQEGNLPVEWRESYVLLGTPGGPNSLPPDVSGLSVNEVLASNVHTLADEAGEYDDWFELYNASGDTLNIGGLCFSDDAGNPCKWQAPLHFPGQTTLPPYGFMLLWADEQPEQGVLHADFKLSAGGETVFVYQRSETAYTVVEQLEFGPQSADISRGRYPDGGTEIAFMSPTPGASNLLSGVDPVNLEVLRVYPNPFSQALFVHAENVEKPYNLFLVNALGQTVAAIREQYQETAVLRRDALPAGLYTVILLDAKGRRWVVKVSKEER
ncbi:MAG: lamin tail domain-containing protein, partial [Saprospiraceae bacterium]|nr:lamin tail domain-containing protein [Saprospiraceae bacterium]